MSPFYILVYEKVVAAELVVRHFSPQNTPLPPALKSGGPPWGGKLILYWGSSVGWVMQKCPRGVCPEGAWLHMHLVDTHLYAPSTRQCEQRQAAAAYAADPANAADAADVCRRASIKGNGIVGLAESFMHGPVAAAASFVRDENLTARHGGEAGGRKVGGRNVVCCHAETGSVEGHVGRFICPARIVGPPQERWTAGVAVDHTDAFAPSHSIDEH